MPELPEVETIKRGLEKPLTNTELLKVQVYTPKLRWPLPLQDLPLFEQQELLAVQRRAKYLLLQFPIGYLIIHLGMSGRLKFVPHHHPLEKHDHIDFIFSAHCLRYHDPRRFGCVLTASTLDDHRLFKHLAPEPLSEAFNSAYLYEKMKNRKTPIKIWLMNQANVVGVGNIYANEALFLAKIHPARLAGSLSLKEAEALVACIREVLHAAILQGGTTLKDYRNSNGEFGYFQQSLHVYNKANTPCINCGSLLTLLKQSGRQTVCCSTCQI